MEGTLGPFTLLLHGTGLRLHVKDVA